MDRPPSRRYPHRKRTFQILLSTDYHGLIFHCTQCTHPFGEVDHRLPAVLVAQDGHHTRHAAQGIVVHDNNFTLVVKDLTQDVVYIKVAIVVIAFHE